MSKVLVIDDDRMVIQQISELVTAFGHKVSFVPKPKFAIQRLETEEFDLILLDINMPEIIGIDLLKSIKSNPEWANIPVVMITGEGDNNTLIECFELGASDYVEKPIIPAVLRARIGARAVPLAHRGAPVRTAAGAMAGAGASFQQSSPNARS